MQRTAPRYSVGYGVRQVSLPARFSLQSREVPWCTGSAEGSVLPPSDSREVNSRRVQKDSTKTANLLLKPLLIEF